uniref:Uncharacterized protein n=1 Tax=Panagrolaimus sp. ES5 TaxID=591445 RepID=A0AC34G223_9BILA
MATDNRLDIVELLFPQYDLNGIAAERPGYSAEELIDWILQNSNKIPSKKQQLKRSQSLRTIKSEAAKTVYSEIVENSLDKSFVSRF